MKEGIRGAKQLIKQLRAVLQNNDLIGDLPPQFYRPICQETSSYTEGETLKDKSEGFQERSYGVVPKEGSFSAWEPQWEVD